MSRLLEQLSFALERAGVDQRTSQVVTELERGPSLHRVPLGAGSASRQRHASQTLEASTDRNEEHRGCLECAGHEVVKAPHLALVQVEARDVGHSGKGDHRDLLARPQQTGRFAGEQLELIRHEDVALGGAVDSVGSSPTGVERLEPHADGAEARGDCRLAELHDSSDGQL